MKRLPEALTELLDALDTGDSAVITLEKGSHILAHALQMRVTVRKGDRVLSKVSLLNLFDRMQQPARPEILEFELVRALRAMKGKM